MISHTLLLLLIIFVPQILDVIAVCGAGYRVEEG
jgi:hypothetical protein